MDLAMTISFMSTAVAVGAFVLSLITFVRAEREKVVNAERDFLRESLYLAERMQGGVLAFRSSPTPDTLKTEVQPVVGELHRLKAPGLEWSRRDYYPHWESLLRAVANVGSAFEGTPDDVVIALKGLLASSHDYAERARTQLLERVAG